MARNRKSQYQKTMGGRKWQAARAELKARGDIQSCWSCGKILYVDVPYPHPNAITLGHYVALEDGGAPHDPANYGPQCMACNFSDGARRTNRRLGRTYRPVTPDRQTTTNPDWYEACRTGITHSTETPSPFAWPSFA